MANPLEKARFDPQPHFVPGNAFATGPGLVQVRGAERLGQRDSEAQAQPPLDEYFNSLFTALGPQHWWPGKTPFEVIIGAILTQNTSWKNVELALANLRAADVFTPVKLEVVNLRRLQSLVRPAGTFRQKARALKAFVRFLRSEHRGSLKRMFATPTISLREKLLKVWGIGPETADAILLYAGQHPV